MSAEVRLFVRGTPAPYAVALSFLMPRPGRPEHPWPSLGDLDKLERAVLDGLVRGGLLADDRHVVELRSSKAFAPGDGEPGVQVAVATALAAAEEAA
jgi:Holliday junction resolvase RusA-like endonuclease